MANQTSIKSSGREPLVVLFSAPDNSRCDAEAKPGELTDSTLFSTRLEEGLLRHIRGECNDVPISGSGTVVDFNDKLLPEVRYAVAADSLPGYSATPSSYPTVTMTVALPESERETLSLILSGEGSRVTEARHSLLDARLGPEIKRQCGNIYAAMAAKGLFAESFTLCHAFRFADGSSLFPSAPVPIIANDGQWALELIRTNLTGTGATLTLSLLRRPCRLFMRLEENEVLHTTAGGGIIGIDIYTTPDNDSFPETGNGVLTRLSSFGLTTASEISSGEPILAGEKQISPNDPSSFGWIFPDSTKTERRKRFTDPTGFRRVAFIPLRTARTGQWIEVPLPRTTDHSSFPEYAPDYFHLIKGEGKLIYSTVTQRLLADPSYFCPGPAVPQSNLAVPSLSSLPWRSGRLLLTVGLRIEGRLRLLTRLLEANEIGRWLDENGRALPFHCIFHPMEECELVALERGDDEGNVWEGSGSGYILFPMERLGCGGTSWTRLAESMPEVEEGNLDTLFPEAERLEMADWRLEVPGELLCSSDTNPLHYPSEGVFRVSDDYVTGGIDYSGRRSGMDLPLLLFLSDGIMLSGHQEVKVGSRKLRLWRPGDYLSTLVALSGHGICSTREGGAFLTRYGIWLLTQSTTRRLSSRSLLFPPSGELRYHPEVSLLEFRVAPDEEKSIEKGETVAWWYDLEEGRELEMLNQSQTDADSEGESGEGKSEGGVCQITTRPFRLPALPSGIRIMTDEGIGTPPASPSGLMSLLEASADLRCWTAIGARPRLEIESLIPFPASPVWYRLKVTVPGDFFRLRGFIVDF